jgi:hypothetical protein
VTLVVSGGCRTHGWDFAIIEGIDDAVELELAVDIRLLELWVGRFINACHAYAN